MKKFKKIMVLGLACLTVMGSSMPIFATDTSIDKDVANVGRSTTIATLDLLDLSAQETTHVDKHGNTVTVGATEAVRNKDPKFIFDLEGQGSWTRKMYVIDLWGGIEYKVDYDINSNNIVTIDMIYGEKTWGLDGGSEKFNILRKTETSSRPAVVEYSIRAGLYIPGTSIGVGTRVHLDSEFYKGKLNVDYY